MNEKIKELAIKSGIRFDHWGHAIASHGNAELESFAEMIVGECMKCCSDIAHDCEVAQQGGVAIQCREEIKEHFGIK